MSEPTIEAMLRARVEGLEAMVREFADLDCAELAPLGECGTCMTCRAKILLAPPRASEPEGTEPIDGEWTGPEMQGDEHGHWQSAEFPGECIDGCSGCEEGNPLPSWRAPRAPEGA